RSGWTMPKPGWKTPLRPTPRISPSSMKPSCANSGKPMARPCWSSSSEKSCSAISTRPTIDRSGHGRDGYPRRCRDGGTGLPLGRWVPPQLLLSAYQSQTQGQGALGGAGKAGDDRSAVCWLPYRCLAVGREQEHHPAPVPDQGLAGSVVFKIVVTVFMLGRLLHWQFFFRV